VRRLLPHRDAGVCARHRDLDPRLAIFRAAAHEQGFQSVHATPMKLRGEVIGTINLFRVAPGALGSAMRPWCRPLPMWRRSE
jgi:hypothetical protein